MTDDRADHSPAENVALIPCLMLSPVEHRNGSYLIADK